MKRPTKSSKPIQIIPQLIGDKTEAGRWFTWAKGKARAMIRFGQLSKVIRPVPDVLIRISVQGSTARVLVRVRRVGALFIATDGPHGAGGVWNGVAFTGADPSLDTINLDVTHPGFPWVDNSPVRLGISSTGLPEPFPSQHPLPEPLEAGTRYFAKNIAAQASQLSETEAGAAVDITSDGRGMIGSDPDNAPIETNVANFDHAKGVWIDVRDGLPSSEHIQSMVLIGTVLYACTQTRVFKWLPVSGKWRDVGYVNIKSSGSDDNRIYAKDDPGTLLSFTVNTDTNVITVPDHTFTPGEIVRFVTGDVLPSGLSDSIDYTVSSMSGDDITVSVQPGTNIALWKVIEYNGQLTIIGHDQETDAPLAKVWNGQAYESLNPPAPTGDSARFLDAAVDPVTGMMYVCGGEDGVRGMLWSYDGSWLALQAEDLEGGEIFDSEFLTLAIHGDYVYTGNLYRVSKDLKNVSRIGGSHLQPTFKHGENAGVVNKILSTDNKLYIGGLFDAFHRYEPEETATPVSNICIFDTLNDAIASDLSGGVKKAGSGTSEVNTLLSIDEGILVGGGSFPFDVLANDAKLGALNLFLLAGEEWSLFQGCCGSRDPINDMIQIPSSITLTSKQG